MSKERGFFRRHKIGTSILIAAALDIARRMRPLPQFSHQPRHPTLDSNQFDHMRSRPPLRDAGPVSTCLPSDVTDGRPVTFDEDPEGLRSSPSLFPGGVQKYLDKNPLD